MHGQLSHGQPPSGFPVGLLSWQQLCAFRHRSTPVPTDGPRARPHDERDKARLDRTRADDMSAPAAADREDDALVTSVPTAALAAAAAASRVVLFLTDGGLYHSTALECTTRTTIAEVKSKVASKHPFLPLDQDRLLWEDAMQLVSG